MLHGCLLEPVSLRPFLLAGSGFCFPALNYLHVRHWLFVCKLQHLAGNTLLTKLGVSVSCHFCAHARVFHSLHVARESVHSRNIDMFTSIWHSSLNFSKKICRGCLKLWLDFEPSLNGNAVWKLLWKRAPSMHIKNEIVAHKKSTVFPLWEVVVEYSMTAHLGYRSHCSLTVSDAHNLPWGRQRWSHQGMRCLLHDFSCTIRLPWLGVAIG